MTLIRTPAKRVTPDFGQPRENIKISIRAPRVGCDVISSAFSSRSEISIHAPRVGCDWAARRHYYSARRFQSTHPGWGATTVVIAPENIVNDFNPRTPGGVRLIAGKHFFNGISFQSTHPGWGATVWQRICGQVWQHFNPRTPGGVRRFGSTHRLCKIRFQSTHPGWGATLEFSRYLEILIYFNPRTPGGVRRHCAILRFLIHIISIHAPRVGCDQQVSQMDK